MVFCTISNEKYLLQGIALAYSLSIVIESEIEYKIYYLCLDENTYSLIKKIIEITDLKIIPIQSKEIEEIYPELIEEKVSDFSNYCFSFSSLLPKFIFDKYNELSVLYVDSDTYFYYSPSLIYEEIGNCDIGIIRHRHNNRSHYAGEYNCNVVFVRNNENGNKILDWWYNAFKSGIPSELSSCGDQKFMEGFEKIIDKNLIKVVDEIVGHGAPWNYKLYTYEKFSQSPSKITWNGKDQIFVFNHFSQFKFNFLTDSFQYTGGSHLGDTLNGEIISKQYELHNMHLEYYNCLKQINKELSLNLEKN